ncbi:MAG: family transporter [Solirubrobacterales bacterium]|nr:family transporter [Solirubrobacterales bacterium]
MLVLVSALSFGGMAIFAKLAYEHGANTASLLTLRFVSAAVILWAIVAVRRRPRPTRRVALGGAGLGFFGYSLQAGGYFAALNHLDASTTALVLYTYPAIVFVGAVVLGREPWSGAKLGALGIAAAGLALVLAGGATGALNTTGVLLAVGAAVAYSTYILVADTVVAGADPFWLTAIVATGAATSVGAYTLISGQLDVGFDAGGWAALAGLVLISTILAITTFFLGLELVGPSTASIVSAVEPAATVALAAAVFGETLSGIQLLGGVLVLSAVVLLQLRVGRVQPGAAPDHAAPAPTAREVPQRAS